MIYCDTSLIVAVLTPEPHSEAAERWLMGKAAAELAVSAWVGTEIASALAMKERRRALTTELRAGAWQRWRHLFARFRALDTAPAAFARAEELVDAGHRGLRAGDALHLAIAERHGCAMATLDADLAAAAVAIGLDVPIILNVP